MKRVLRRIVGLRLAALPLLLTGCGDERGSIDAAVALAETLYPGELELLDSQLLTDQYAVTLAVKGDRFSRVRFTVDRDPAKCRIGTRCEDRLRAAYADGIAAGTKLKAMAATLPECGIAILGIDDARISPAFRTDIELAMNPADQQPALDRLSACIAAFRAKLPVDATPDQRAVALRILLPRPGKAVPPDPSPTFEKRLDRSRFDEPTYVIFAGPDETTLRAAAIRLHPGFVSNVKIRNHLASQAREVLSAQHQTGHIPHFVQFHNARLDPQRLDVLRTYVLACSVHEQGKGPCKTDLAIRLRYDLATSKVSETAVLQDIRADNGSLNLPPLPGR